MTIEELIGLYKTKQDEYILFTSSFDECKISLESMLKFYESEKSYHLLDAITALQLFINTVEEKYKILKTELFDLEKEIIDYRNKIVKDMQDMLNISEKITRTLSIESSYNKTQESTVVSVAKKLYPNLIDNHDIRAAPPIYGNIYKDEFRTTLELKDKDFQKEVKEFLPFDPMNSNSPFFSGAQNV